MNKNKKFLSAVLAAGLAFCIGMPMAFATDDNAEEQLVINDATLTACEECGEEGEHFESCSQHEEAAADLPLYEQLVAAEDVDELYTLMLNAMEERPADLMDLAFGEIIALEGLVDELDPDASYEYREDLLDTLSYIKGELLLDGDPVVLPEGNEINGTKVYYAGAELAACFAGANDTDAVYYDSAADALVFRANSNVTAGTNDPYVTFRAPDTSLQASDYPYIAITYKTAKSGTNSQLHLLSSKNASANASYAPGYSLNADGEYHTAIVNAGACSIWSDSTIIGFRFDYFGTGNPGDVLYVDSIAFCSDSQHANYVKWERETLRGDTPAEFYASQGMELSFSNSSDGKNLGTASGHNVVSSYDEEEGAVKLTVQHTNCATCNSTNGHYKGATDVQWGTGGSADPFDPQIIFNVPGGVTDSYKYVVITYMCKDMYMNGNYIPGENKNGDDCYDDGKYSAQEDIPINVGLFPQTASGGYSPHYERNVALLDEDVYYSVYIPLTDELQGGETKNVRFDPFNCHFVEAGSALYLSSVIFCNSLEEAEDKVEDQLEKHPYGYDLVFDKNTEDAVSGMPQIYPIYTTKSTHEFTMADYSTPSRSHYDFVGWAENEDGSSLVGDTHTMTGVQDSTVHDTLYAAWKPKDYSIAYDLAGGLVTGDNPTSYNIESDVITLKNPKKENYEFIGWTGTGLTEPTMEVVIPAGSSGDRSYTANWAESKVQLSYVAVGPEGDLDFGTVSSPSEQVDKVTGDAAGSTATAGYGYRFVGWYSDAACANKVGDGAKFVPTKAFNELWAEATYYAKFERATAALTIDKSIEGADDAEQAFMFSVKGESHWGEEVDMVVSRQGEGSITIADLPVGKYTVTELLDWSWRYEALIGPEAGREIVFDQDATVAFVNYKSVNTWLSDEAVCNNVFAGKSN